MTTLAPTGRKYPLGSPERDEILRGNHKGVYPFNGPTRADLSGKAFRVLQAKWYAKAKAAKGGVHDEHPVDPGWWGEQDEYRVKPEDYGTNHTEVLSLDFEYGETEDDDPYTLLEVVSENDHHAYSPSEEPEVVDDDTEVLLEKLNTEAGLTGRECEVAEWIALGNRVDSVDDYTTPLTLALGITPTNARTVMNRLTQKLKPYYHHRIKEHVRTRLVSSSEGYCGVPKQRMSRPFKWPSVRLSVKRKNGTMDDFDCAVVYGPMVTITAGQEVL